MNEEALSKDKKHLTRSEKREIRKQKLKNRLIRLDDIKYQGPISYRVLRIITWVLIAIIYSDASADTDYLFSIFNAYELGQAVSMIVAIPILFLYSYTRERKNTLIDIFIPIVGIGLCAFVYLEGIYQFIINATA